MKKKKCPLCQIEITANNFTRHIKYCNGTGPRAIKRANAPKKGSKECSAKISEGMKKKNLVPWNKGTVGQIIAWNKGKKCPQISGNQGGIRKGSGRGKSGWYKGYWCDSSWELAYVIYNLEHDIKFERNKQSFEYEFEGEIFKYYPDFIMEDGSYTEVKGYMDKKNKAKHQQFNGVLNVLEKDEMKPYLEYTTNKYGKNFIELYGSSPVGRGNCLENSWR